MPNRLATASSPYLRQHADNPVDWWEWGPDAFRVARERDVPVFLSVGYASCHWCHVMAHESFEDAAIAEVLNRDFVPVKVDREERPDVDAVYMAAVQAMTGHGGWPMSVFASPDGRPFHAGTYWPPQRRGGMPAFGEVLAAVTRAWRADRDGVADLGTRLATHLQQVTVLPEGEVAPDDALADAARTGVLALWDRDLGGFGRAPKFPQAMVVDWLLAHHTRTGEASALQAAMHALWAMSAGGIHDQIGGGFARYSTDARWLVPHFEKMLYDNALILRAAVHATWLTGDPRMRFVARRTADWLIREAQLPDGGFVSGFDADSDGVEGAFFVWRPDEIADALATTDADPEEWSGRYGVTTTGNFVLEPTGDRTVSDARVSILHEATPFDFSDRGLVARREVVDLALLSRRARRVPPGVDDKVLTSWSALAVEALAEAAVVLDDLGVLTAARRALAFIERELVVDGRLHHTWSARSGAGVPAFCEDVAGLARASLVVHEVTQEHDLVARAAALAADADARFSADDGTWYDTAEDAESLVARPRATWDNATPAASSVMVDVHLRLAGLTGAAHHAERAERALRAFAPSVERAPLGHGELLRGLERHLAAREIAIVGGSAEVRDLLDEVRTAWRPGAVVAVGDGRQAPLPLLRDRPLVGGRATAYVCRGHVCDRPVTDAAELREVLER